MARSAFRYGGKTRRNVALALLGIAALLIVAKLVFLQTVTADFLVKESMSRSLRITEEDALRGMILDREGEPLAISSVISNLVVNPRQMWATINGDFTRLQEKCLAKKDISPDCDWVNDNDLDQDVRLVRYQYQRLRPAAMMLNQSVDELYRTLDKRKNRQFYYVERSLSPMQVDDVLSANVPGFDREDTYQRFYPTGALMGQIIGYTDIDEKGQEGMELVYNSWLAGQKGQVKVIKDRNRKTLRMVEEIRPASPGSPLQLSIDKRIQYIMHDVLQRTLDQFSAKSASGVMVDVKTGEVLAMVSLPTGNPNNTMERKPELMKNHIITDVFEPGSTIKPIAVAAALDAGVITPSTRFNTNGTLRIGKNIVRDTHWYGELDTTGVIRKSSNVGMALISKRLPKTAYNDFLHRMGFGRKTGVAFPGEQAGVVQPAEKLNEFGYATTMFGYGMSATALQLAHAYATLANDGVALPLSLLKQNMPPEGERVLKAETAQALRGMLVAAVSQGGTGTRAQMPSYTVAGKTGTSHKIIDGGYAKNRYRSLFAGYAPANNPRIAMVIVVDDPVGKAYYGGLVAAPPFAEIGEWALNILGVLPDKVAKSDQVKLEFEVDPDMAPDLALIEDPSARVVQ
ncbi:penicillin-binding protein 2 [Cardiobacteriaceae bacterium TAE3-ERU3]|nr:penicillin-binding protein 2 [Cardiobacteriaceae bacterium TAE3-ERU3]